MTARTVQEPLFVVALGFFSPEFSAEDLRQAKALLKLQDLTVAFRRSFEGVINAAMNARNIVITIACYRESGVRKSYA